MQAIILAAGEGKRMRPLTLTVPKTLIEIKGKPIISHILAALPNEIDEVIVVVRYLGEKIRAYLGSDFGGRKIVYVEGRGQGTAADFLLTRPYVNSERFLLIYGDELPRPDDISNCLKHEFSLLVFKSDNPTAHGVVILNEDGLVEGVMEKPKNPPSEIAVDGVMVLGRKMFEYQPVSGQGGEFYLTSLVDQFVKDHKVYSVMSVGFIGDITTPADIERVEKVL
ncbi:MAG: nucleotidyltransferase family protein [Patescibacteria group bacterium]